MNVNRGEFCKVFSSSNTQPLISKNSLQNLYDFSENDLIEKLIFRKSFPEKVNKQKQSNVQFL